MRLILKKPSAEMLMKGLEGNPDTDAFRAVMVEKVERLRATDLEVDLGLLGEEGLLAVEQIARDEGDRAVINQLGTYRRILANPREAKISRLAHLEGAIVEWVLQDVIKGWIFQRLETGELQAWVVGGVRFDIPRQGADPSVTVQLWANAPMMRGSDSQRHSSSQSISFGQGHLPANSDELFGHGRWLHETAELHAEYEEARERFAEIHAQPNQQFRLAPGVYRRGGLNVSYNDSKFVIGAQHRCINDETLVSRPVRDSAARDGWDDRVAEKPRGKKAPRGARVIPDDAFTQMPSHFLHLVYDLDAHGYAWVPSSALMEYVYDESKADMIVLPESHRDLIDILTSDAELLIEDVVEGKTGGTTILLEGDPGLGKTLLAEVYAEKMRRALYRIQAGQLGTTPESVAKGLETVYENARRWGTCVVLIDEADVYIRKRDSSMEHNAVVAAMLVSMERQTEITFLATNRQNDVDEAIVSRCIALVHFEMPDGAASKRIWEIQSQLMGLDLKDDVIDGIVEHHRTPNGQKASGRDIRALLKLGYRYHHQRRQEITVDLLKQLGSFKRL